MSIFGQMRSAVAELSNFKIVLPKLEFFIERCRKTLSMVYKTMFPRNPQPEEFTGLLEKFKDIQAVQNLVKT